MRKNRNYHHKYQYIAGVDEAGRGPLAGPLVVAAVILGKCKIPGLDDSKKLSPAKRELLFEKIKNRAKCWHIEVVSVSDIDRLNILQATMLGMTNSVHNLQIKPDFCLIDGNKVPQELTKFAKAIVKGDSKYAEISAASILAKVYRDRLMQDIHQQYPQYNFASNKGYPTREHKEALQKFGITNWHRKSFKPVNQIDFNYLLNRND
mgnify:CR=1 FL=1